MRRRLWRAAQLSALCLGHLRAASPPHTFGAASRRVARQAPRPPSQPECLTRPSPGRAQAKDSVAPRRGCSQLPASAPTFARDAASGWGRSCRAASCPATGGGFVTQGPGPRAAQARHAGSTSTTRCGRCPSLSRSAPLAPNMQDRPGLFLVAPFFEHSCSAASMGQPVKGGCAFPGRQGTGSPHTPVRPGSRPLGTTAAATAAGRARDSGARPALTARRQVCCRAAPTPRRLAPLQCWRAAAALAATMVTRSVAARRWCLRTPLRCPPPPSRPRRPCPRTDGPRRVVRGKHCRPLGRAWPRGQLVSTCTGACDKQARAARHWARRAAHLRVR